MATRKFQSTYVILIVVLLDSTAVNDGFLPHLSTCFHLLSKFVRITYELITPLPFFWLIIIYFLLLYCHILSEEDERESAILRVKLPLTCDLQSSHLLLPNNLIISAVLRGKTREILNYLDLSLGLNPLYVSVGAPALHSHNVS